MISAALIGQVRRFNRAVAEGIGVLDGHFLGRKRPVGEARVLWEIGTDGSEVRALRARLGLDSGYLSRVLRSLERQQLVRVRMSATDERVRFAYLTRAGQAERIELDRRSKALASRILEPLNERQRGTLLAAMSEVERLIEASLVTFAVEDAASADARWCFEQYFVELDARFEEGFDPELSLPITAADLTVPAGALVIARLRGRPVGCGAVKVSRNAPAHLRRMWVSPTVRGLGVGRRLLQELEHAAWDLGARRIRLDTHRSLTEAIAMYRRSGYTEAAPASGERYADFWFEKRLRRGTRERIRPKTP
jgi:DNA-binding MarR family transcriptional regulator/GNAT superfamily N-acetyltransferase